MHAVFRVPGTAYNGERNNSRGQQFNYQSTKQQQLLHCNKLFTHPVEVDAIVGAQLAGIRKLPGGPSVPPRNGAGLAGIDMITRQPKRVTCTQPVVGGQFRFEVRLAAVDIGHGFAG